MAIANLQETLLSYTLRKNQLNLDIMEYQSQKNLAIASVADTNSLLASGKAELRDYFKYLYNNDEELQEAYTDYTEIPEFEEEIDKLTAQIQDELDELSAWETQLNAQITTASAELTEVEAYIQSVTTMLQSNIQGDFNYGLGQ
ncbi:MAG: hypothetical protein MJ230_04735 [bacterium]|nr:hypothetical protein [bacterium]